MKGLSILGSTGSIGRNVLRTVDAFPGRFEVISLAAGSNVDILAEQIERYRPRLVSVATPEAREALARQLDLSGVRVETGEAGMVSVATSDGTQIVVAAAVGAVGLVPTYKAVEAGRDVALANKETLVIAGELLVSKARETGARILPIDSEHCALHQCLDGRVPESVARLVLTASGGPFRERALESLVNVTPAEALKHPTWNMGRKISIDSATMMNKGLEVIEAHWLFGLPGKRIDVLIHPQSVVHSMVEFVDGTILAQLGATDMRMPIQYALSYPEVWSGAIPGMDLTQALHLDFEPPSPERFPCLDLAYRALERGGAQPAILNAANEEAVAAFLDGEISFLAISETIGAVMDMQGVSDIETLEDALNADRGARVAARQLLHEKAAVHAAAGH
jgi:1-deoxy-D-xylulose-5-phosphate reductoisomerase